MNAATEVAIIGAGPFGLSIAAQLSERGVPFRIFGPPMESWRKHMPAGMRLKSDGFASDLFDKKTGYTLQKYCAEQNIPYDDLRVPVQLETFIAYGLAFQQKLVPTLENKLVVGLKRSGNLFELTLDNNERVTAHRVVLATGISQFQRTPKELAQLPQTICTHAYEHSDLSDFANKKVAVIGGGASALDTAALLHKAGAAVALISRHPVHFHQPPGNKPRSLWQRMRHPHYGLGSSLRSTLYTWFPNLFHYLPQKLRLRIVRRHLGPSGGWYVRDHVVGKVTMHLGHSLKSATAAESGVNLTFNSPSGGVLDLHVDHVIAATGYKPKLERLGLFDPALLEQIVTEDESPVLSKNFESSVPNLYFVGLAAANSFGPLLRFALGARFTSHRIAAHLDTVTRRSRVASAATLIAQ